MKHWLWISLLFVLFIYGSVDAQATPSQTDEFIYVSAVAWSHDGSKIAAAGTQLPGIVGYLRIFDAQNGNILYALDSNPGGYTSLDWSPDDQFIALGSYDQSIWIFDVEAQKVVSGLFGHRATVTGVSWNRDGTQLVSSGSWDGLVILWDRISHEKIRDVQDSGSFLTDAAFSPDGRRIAIGGEFGLRVLASDGDNPTAVKRFSLRDVSVSALAWNPDGSRIAFGTQTFPSITQPEHKQNSTLYIVDSNRGMEITSWLTDGETVTGIAWSRDGVLLATQSGDHSVKVWEADSGELLQPFAESAPDNKSHLYNPSFSPYGGRLAYGGILSAEASTAADNSQGDIQVLGGGAVRIVVPAPSVERLRGIIAVCNLDEAMTRTLNSAIDSGNLDQFTADVQAAPAGTIPPACAADLIAVAGALEAKS